MTTVVATICLCRPSAIGTALICVILSGAVLRRSISGYVTTRLYVPSFISTLAVGGIALVGGAVYVGPAGAVRWMPRCGTTTFGWMYRLGRRFARMN